MTDRSQALGAASMYHLLRERRLRERAAAQPQRGGQRRTIAGPPRASGDAATAASGEALPALRFISNYVVHLGRFSTSGENVYLLTYRHDVGSRADNYLPTRRG